jgi:hypothetical protein
LVFDFPRLSAFFMMPPACVDGPNITLVHLFD